MPILEYPPPPDGVDNNGSSARGWGTGWPLCQKDRQRWIYLTNKVGLQVRVEIAELVQILLNEVLRHGYVIRDADSAGFVCRPIAHTLIPSNHSWGLAVDINWRDNPMGTHTTDIPRWMVNLMWDYKFYWGGWYADPDPMHFEFVGTPTDATAMTRLARKEFAVTGPVEADLVKRQEDALSEIWAFVVAVRDGVKAPKVPTNAGGFTQLQFQLDRIEDKLDQLLARGGTATLEGTVRLVPGTPTT